MSGDSSDDSDVESDIGEKMAQIHEKQQQDDERYPRRAESDSDDDSDGAARREVVLLRDTRRRAASSHIPKSGAADSVDVKMQKLEFKQALHARRNRLQAKRNAECGRNSSSSSSDDGDEIQVVQNSQTIASKKRMKSKYCLDASMEIDDSDDDDDDLQHEGMTQNVKDVLELQKRHAASVQLQKIINERSILSTSCDGDEIQIVDGPAPSSLWLSLQVIASVRHQKDAGRAKEHKQTMITVQDTQTVQVVLDQALQQWQYPADKTVAILKYNGQTLQNRFALAMYGITAHGAVINADITLLDSSNSTKSQHLPTEDLGKLMRVTLRCQKDTKVMKIGIKEPFQRLVERYEQQNHCLGKVKRLEFDGDALPLHTTPATHDMEDEDLIDVVMV